jgi:DNA-damage-inducible protein J
MINNAVVRARVNEEIKEEANIVLSSIGLTVSEAFRMMLFRIAHEKSLPFAPLIPNKTTIEAMKASKKGDLKETDNIASLFKELNAKD